MMRKTPMWYQMFEVVGSLVTWILFLLAGLIMLICNFGRDYLGWFK